MSYKNKLDQFNSNLKYYDELLLLQLMLCNAEGKILDYGCGTGFAASCLREHGFDVSGYDAVKHEPNFEYDGATGTYDVVYFMHSIAHIPGVKEVLRALNTREIIVITPNLGWLRLQNSANYLPDITVLEHFTKKTLEDLFISCGYNIELSGQFGNRTENQCERLLLKATKIN